MNKTLNKKLNYLFDLDEKKSYKIEQNDLTTYLVRSNGLYYVCIPFNKHKVNEKFVGMQVKTELINYSDISVVCLCLVSKIDIDKEKLLLVAEDFAKTENRSQIIDDPYSWIDKWRTIFGDSLSAKKVFDVLGELISLKECYSIDKTFIWEGPNSGTHDLVSERFNVEVKTTSQKRNSIIGIHSAYQLSSDKPSKLLFVRLERKPYCVTINQLVTDLVQMGYDSKSLEDNLAKCGYPKGARLREQSYDILGIYSYEINDKNFPIFSVDELNNMFAPKKNIIGYSLEVDLTGLDHEVVYEKE